MKKTVCVDLDGTIARYDGWKGIEHFGDPLPGAKEFLERLGENYKILIYTTRCNEQMNGEVPHQLRNRVEAWLQRHQLRYDDIHTGQGKPMCIAFIDDRAIMIKENVDWTPAYSDLILRFVAELEKRKVVTEE